MGITKLSLKYLVLQKKQSAFSIVGIMLSAILITVIFTAVRTMINFSYNITAQKSGISHAKITTSAQYSADISKNVAFEEVDMVTLFSIESLYNQVVKSGNEDYVFSSNISNSLYSITFAAVDYNDCQLNSHYTDDISEGILPKNENEIVIPKKMLHSFDNPSINDEILISLDFFQYKEKPFISAEDYLKSSEKINSAEKTFIMCGTTLGDEFIISPQNNFFEELSIPQTSELSVRFKKSVDFMDKTVDEMFFELDSTHRDFSFDENIFITRAEFVGTSAKFFDIQVFSALFVTIIVLLFCCRMVVNCSFEIITKECIRQYGILKTTGISSAQLTSLVLIQASALSAAGIIPGIGGGLLLSAGLYRLISLSESFKSATDYAAVKCNGCFDLYISITLLTIIALILFLWVLLSSLGTARKVVKYTPAEAILGSYRALSLQDTKHSKIIKKLFGCIGSLSFQNIKANRERHRSSVVAIALSITIFSVSAIVLTTYSDFSKQNRSIGKHDIAVAFSSDYDYHEAKLILDNCNYFSKIEYENLNLGEDNSFLHSFALNLNDKNDHPKASEYLTNVNGIVRVANSLSSDYIINLRFLATSLIGKFLIMIIAVIVSVNIINVISTSVYARKQEFAIFRAVGMSNLQILRMLILEIIVYTLVATLFSILIVIIIVFFTTLSYYLLIGNMVIGFKQLASISFIKITFAGLITLAVAFLSVLLSLRHVTSEEIIHDLKSK